MADHGAPIVVSIVRSPADLLAMISQKRNDSEFEVTSKPLSQIRRSIYPRKEPLEASWMYLSAVKSVDAETLFHVVVVLLDTVPDVSAVKSAAPLPDEWDAPPVMLRSTEANPRAFKGTKYQPPKARRLPQIDVRPHLCDARALNALLSTLWKFWDAVRPRLARAAYSDAALNSVEEELRPEDSRKVPWTLPAKFVSHLWQIVRHQLARDRSRLLSLFAVLEMETDQRAFAALIRLAAIADVEAAYSWGRVSAVLPAHRRAAFFEKLIETQAYVSLPQPFTRCELEETSMLAGDEQFPLWLDQLLLHTKQASSAAYLLSGFRLAAQFNPEYRFQNIRQCANFPEKDAEEISIQFDGSSWLALSLWEQCGRLPELAELIRKSQWRAFTPAAARSYFCLFTRIVYDGLPEPAIQKKWAEVARQIPRIESVILATPSEYQQKAVYYIGEWLTLWDDPKAIRKHLPSGFQLLNRLARPPFSNRGNADRAVSYFLELENAEDLQRFLNIGDKVLEVLEAACRRSNDEVLISRGLAQLTRILSRFAVAALAVAPKRLCRSAKLLGSVSEPVRQRILTDCKAHPLFQIDPERIPIRELCTEIVRHRRGKMENPIPARLGAWVRREIDLSPARLERYQRVVSSKLLLTRLSLIEESVLDCLKRGLPDRQIKEGDEHALRLLGTLRENRRGLRKFLNAYWNGETDYLSKHPATIAWYRKHKTIPRNVWEQGISFQRGQISILVESDPFEVLKLGTYVGSCLAIGGMCSDSAVAALLDANKRVLYARDHRQRVVARQLVAVSDDDRLVCFSVYPLSAGKEVKALFREYDFAFAKSLGVSVYEPSETSTGYEVSSVLSVYWWDDSSWDFELS